MLPEIKFDNGAIWFNTNEIDDNWVQLEYCTDFKIEEEQENMKQCEFQIGDVFIVKDEVDDANDGEAILIAPGFSGKDFKVTQSDKGVVVVVEKICEDCGEPTTESFYFNFDPYYDVIDVACNVKNGICTLQVLYDTESNVTITED